MDPSWIFEAVSVWRWIAVVLIAWAAPPLIAYLARAVSFREKRKKECRHLQGKVQGLLADEFPDETVDSPTTPFSWFTDPELSNALVASNVFAYVIPEGPVRKKDLEYVVRYGSVIGASELRIYTHEPPPLPPEEIIVKERVIGIRGVAGCACGR
jgi:hypothetical protein